MIKTLDGVLGEKYANLGFWLEEDAGTITILHFKDNPKSVAYYNQRKAPRRAIRQACREYLDRLNGKGVPVEG